MQTRLLITLFIFGLLKMNLAFAEYTPPTAEAIQKMISLEPAKNSGQKNKITLTLPPSATKNGIEYVYIVSKDLAVKPTYDQAMSKMKPVVFYKGATSSIEFPFSDHENAINYHYLRIFLNYYSDVGRFQWGPHTGYLCDIYLTQTVKGYFSTTHGGEWIIKCEPSEKTYGEKAYPFY
jgi:hypothetical protein